MEADDGDSDDVVKSRENRNQEVLISQGIPEEVFRMDGMYVIHRLKLLAKRRVLIDVDLADIRDELQTNMIFTANEIQMAKSEGGDQERMRWILDKLPTKGPLAYQCFRDALKERSRWLVEALDETEIDRESLVKFCKTIDVKVSSDVKEPRDKVVPLDVHQSMAAFEARKEAIVNDQIGRLRESTRLLNSALTSLNLPAAIENLSGNKVLPAVFEKAAIVRAMGGIAYLGKLMSELPESLAKNKKIIDEIERLLDEEAQADEQLRDQFKERWTRSSSDKLTEPFRANASVSRATISSAIQADHLVRDKFDKNREGFDLLSMSDGEIEKALLSGSPIVALKGNTVIEELHKLMKQVDVIKAERDVMEKEINAAKCDMASTFLSALAKDGAISVEDLSTEQLDRSYGALREQVADSCQHQEDILAKLRDASSRFREAKIQNESAVARYHEEKLKNIATAYDNFMELKYSLEEGSKFYDDLRKVLVNLQNKVNDFCFARNAEKVDLMKDLSNRSQAPSSPSNPIYAAHSSQPTSGAASTNETVNCINTEGSHQSDLWGPLPEGWEKRVDQKGESYFVNHKKKKTQWDDPRILDRMDAKLYVRFCYMNKIIKLRTQKC